MAHLDAPEEQALPARPSTGRELADGHGSASEQALSTADAALFVLDAPGGSVVSLGGIDGAALQRLVDQADHISDHRRALFLRLSPAGSASAYVEQVIVAVARAAMHLWPCWFTDVSFAMCRDDALGRRAAAIIAREAA